jgi:hypothetical protein
MGCKLHRHSKLRRRIVRRSHGKGQPLLRTVYPYATIPTVDTVSRYDGWDLLAELSATNLSMHQACVWGGLGQNGRAEPLRRKGRTFEHDSYARETNTMRVTL